MVRKELGLALIALAGGLAANSLLGPLAGDVIRYRFSETLVHQGMGLDFVSLVVVAPLCVAVGALALRGHPAAPAVALGPAAYVAYVSVQYVIGPEYLTLPGNNERFVPFHLALFVLAGGIAVRAWTALEPARLMPSRRCRRRWAWAMFALGGLLVLRYAPFLVELVGGDPEVTEYTANPTSFLLILTLDLGVFAPAAFAGGIGLRRGHDGGVRALFAVVGWFALVGAAVAAMAVVMRIHGDPGISTGATAVFVGLAIALGLVAGRLYGTAFRTSTA